MEVFKNKTPKRTEKSRNLLRDFFFLFLLIFLFILIFGAIYKNYSIYFFAKHWKEFSTILLLLLIIEIIVVFQKKE